MTETTAKSQPKGDKRNIPEEIHRLASALSRELMRIPEKDSGEGMGHSPQEDDKQKRNLEGVDGQQTG